MQHSAISMKKRVKYQAYCAFMIGHLYKCISDHTYELLLLGSKDPEILSTYSPYDKYYVTLKARYINGALSFLRDAVLKQTEIKWIECCQKAIEKITKQSNEHV